jgi:hypothetical protein
VYCTVLAYSKDTLTVSVLSLLRRRSNFRSFPIAFLMFSLSKTEEFLLFFRSKCNTFLAPLYLIILRVSRTGLLPSLQTAHAHCKPTSHVRIKTDIFFSNLATKTTKKTFTVTLRGFGSSYDKIRRLFLSTLMLYTADSGNVLLMKVSLHSRTDVGNL